MDDIKVSIITVCYNSEKTIRRTIESVIGQTYSNIEYIIVDGKSTDNTLAIIKEYVSNHDSVIRWISEPDNGIYDAMNKGIAMATGEIVGIINSDDWYEMDAIRKVVSAYNSELKYQIMYGMLKTVHNDEVIAVSWKSHKSLKGGMIGHPACFVTKKLYEDKGSYSIDYKYVSDYDFMLRMSNDNEVCFVPVFEILADFTTGGACSTGKAWIELVDLQYRYGIITRKEYMKYMLTDKLYRAYRTIIKKG